MNNPNKSLRALMALLLAMAIPSSAVALGGEAQATATCTHNGGNSIYYTGGTSYYAKAYGGIENIGYTYKAQGSGTLNFPSADAGSWPLKSSATAGDQWRTSSALTFGATLVAEAVSSATPTPVWNNGWARYSDDDEAVCGSGFAAPPTPIIGSYCQMIEAIPAVDSVGTLLWSATTAGHFFSMGGTTKRVDSALGFVDGIFDGPLVDLPEDAQARRIVHVVSSPDMCLVTSTSLP